MGFGLGFGSGGGFHLFQQASHHAAQYEEQAKNSSKNVDFFLVCRHAEYIRMFLFYLLKPNLKTAKRASFRRRRCLCCCTTPLPPLLLLLPLVIPCCCAAPFSVLLPRYDFFRFCNFVLVHNNAMTRLENEVGTTQ